MFSIKKAIQSIDLFGHPIQFTFNQKPTQTSFFGGVITLVLIGVFTLISFQGLLDVLMRANITSYTNDVYANDPPYIDMSPSIFNWAISFSPTNINVWEGSGKYFQVDITHSANSRDQNGNTVKKKVTIPMEPCQLENFNAKAQSVLLGVTTNISSLLCPKINNEIWLQGKYTSKDFAFLKFAISKCKNTTNTTCASDEKIEAMYASNQGKVYFNIFVMNNIINMYDFANPISSFLDDRTYVLLNNQAYTETNFYFTKNKIFTDSSILTTNYEDDLDSYIFDDSYDQTVLPLTSDNGVISNIYFRSNFLAKDQYRTFDKIGRFISYIGGFWSVLYLCFSIVGKRFNKHRFLVKIANELYDFEGRTELEKNRNEKQKKSKKPDLKISKDPKSYAPSIHSETFQINQKLEEYLEKKNQFKLVAGLRYLFGCLFKGPDKEDFRVQKKLREIAFKELNKDVDIIHLLKKMKQIDKIKALMLNETQNCLFDFNHKTKIDENFDKRRNSSLKFLTRMESRKKHIRRNHLEDGFSEIKNYFDAYVILKKDTNEENFNFNNKIIKLIDEDLMKIFNNMPDSFTVSEKFPMLFAKKTISMSEKSDHRILSKPKLSKKSSRIEKKIYVS